MSESCEGLLTMPDAIREEYERTGMIAQSFRLADASVLPELLREAAMFDTAVEELAEQGRAASPIFVPTRSAPLPATRRSSPLCRASSAPMNPG